jgi:hypothetical protein
MQKAASRVLLSRQESTRHVGRPDVPGLGDVEATQKVGVAASDHEAAACELPCVRG